MKEIIFNKKKVKIRKHLKSDLRNVKKFQNFINSLIEENAQIMFDQKISLKEERKWLNEQLKKQRNKRTVSLIVEADSKIVGITEIFLGEARQKHIGNFGITIRKGYRGMGLGTYLMGEVIKLAKRELKPKPKFIRLRVFSTNRPAIGFYKKFSFKQVARIPRQIQYNGKLLDEIIMLRRA